MMETMRRGLNGTIRTDHVPNMGFLGRWGTYACPQCLPSDIVPIRSWTRTLRRPGIRHRHLPYHTMPLLINGHAAAVLAVHPYHVMRHAAVLTILFADVGDAGTMSHHAMRHAAILPVLFAAAGAAMTSLLSTPHYFIVVVQFVGMGRHVQCESARDGSVVGIWGLCRLHVCVCACVCVCGGGTL